MKKSFTLILLYFPGIIFSQHAVADTTIEGVRISFNYSPAIFPASWNDGPINANAEAISMKETSRSKLIISKALHKYPAAVLKNNLAAVFYLKKMSFFNVSYGGTNSTETLYLTNDGLDMGYTEIYMEQNFHHEFSSILFRNYPEIFDSAVWKAANISGFDYNDPEDGVGAIRENKSSQDLDTSLSAKGFLTQYALSSLENDINTLAQNIFTPSPGFWDFVKAYPRIGKKVQLLISFYHKIDPLFTEAYFRKFD